MESIEAVYLTIGCFISTVQPFNHLFIRTEFFGYFVFIGKTDDLCDIEFKCIAVFVEKLLGGQWISTISICNKFKVFRQLF